eukprot:TRINITY_DN18929_c0_g1::TRINITY_DN18929_c0_g1_i1::g.1421::m.1421 TRINITY_DN18929_c0_g1::TRINITY_DN18929_c0_g1_i1::g.1421  ORF type:complete len:682 (-),score=163.39,sp/Q54RF3/EI2BE_DICDI/35.78/1e-136,W2/PF02020.13/6.4e-22,Hexapep/PF00132.19/0.29,Hexapep/PF00132.19/0.059,Hexapep/PF00132.19/0.00016,Hexapep/PF00132.19/22,Hexapep/PF00132.19/0.00058,NTP_transferase/PF00483.18/2.8e-07,Hexapep_2/PF14602.1/0.011,Hexapep_2/PF14602.1/0.045,Hexapep_2/PF14602.1/0.31,NTP_transf_3/PF12804.2/0.022 TRINITY_DN189
MAGDKKSKPPRPSVQSALDMGVEKKLQALLLADSFVMRFRPISVETPKVLLPLVNIPMIEYTLEWLASNNVQEIYVFCATFATEIVGYLQKSKWTEARVPQIHTIVAPGCMSVGDALREIDQKQIFVHDFVLVSGDVVTNMSLESAIEAHARRREHDKLAIMTRVFRKAPPLHGSRGVDDQSFLIVDKTSNQILDYVDFSLDKQTEIDVAHLENRPEGVELRADLVPTNIDICSPEVLVQFTDNFDYQDMCSDFIRGVLQSEILGQKIYSHVIGPTEYATRVNCLRSYASVSRDIVRRWAYPLSPDSNLFGDTTYRISRGRVYKEESVSVARSAHVGNNTVIGADSTLADDVTVSDTVIGRRCTIATGAKIKSSFLWDDVVVGEGSVIEGALLCKGVRIGKKATIQRGCVLSFGVVIDDGVTVGAHTRITRSAYIDEDSLEEIDSDELRAQLSGDSEPKVVGAKGQGRRWKCSQADLPKRNSVACEAGPWDEDDHADGAWVEEEDAGHESDHGETGINDFMKEATDTMRRGIREKISIDNLALEINGLKFAHNRTFNQCVEAILTVILDSVDTTVQPKQFIVNVKTAIKTWHKLIRRFMFGEEDQVELILTIEDYCTDHEKMFAVFHHILHVLYDLDVLSEESILQWAEEEEENNTVNKKFLEMCRPLIKWLQEADEESDE